MLITLLYSGLLGLVYLVLTWRVIRMRQASSINLGSGGDTMLERRIRAHGNFSEYVPIILIMLALLENAGAHPYLLHILGSGLLLARLLHGFALSFTKKWFPGRFFGALLTLICLLLGSLAAIYTAISA